MNYPKNELIAQNGFLSLYLDHEYFEDEYGQINYVSCRVLNDLNFYGRIYAETRAAAIEKFYNHEIELEDK